MKRLTVARIKKLRRPGRYSDGHCLFLRVAPGGSRQWVQRLTVHGKRRDIGLGSAELVTLTEARIRAFDNRKLARVDGGDPLAGKRKETSISFQEAARKTHQANLGRWSAQTARNWLKSLELHVLPILGDMRIDAISRQDILRTLTRNDFWINQPQTAKKIRQRVRMVLHWAVAHGVIEKNVADDSMDAALPAVQKKSTNLRAMPFNEVGAALQTVDGSTASNAVKLCIRFLVLTACRSGEVLGATWKEVDDQKWCIPGKRMKSGVEHRVPLSDEAVAVLEQARELSDGSGFVFPSPKRRGSPLSSMSLTMTMRKVGLSDRATLHGFRSSFRVWASEMTNEDHAVMELCLAHQVGSDVERAYARSDLFSKRRSLMQRWAAYLYGSRIGKVVNFGG